MFDRRTSLFLPCALLALGLLRSSALAGDKPIVPKDEPILLFNGKDLGNFYTWLQDDKFEDPRRVFTVVDAIDGAPAIRISGDGYGGIITKEAYADYHLVCEFRWGPCTWRNRKDRSRDSGILLHCFGPEGMNGEGPWMASVECQIIEGGVGDLLVVGGKDKEGNLLTPKATCEVTKDRDGETVWKKGGEKKTFTSGRVNWFGRDPDWKDVLGFRGKNDVESPGYEWTKVEVIAKGDTLVYLVNGTVVNEATEVYPASGKLLFQTEGAEIYFRKIELHPLKN
jgi:hypothetical protein